MRRDRITAASPTVMRVGLLSDSHGRAEITRLAARLLVERGADLLLHLGDLGSPEVLDAVVEAGRPVQAVLGNADEGLPDILERARRLGLTLPATFGEVAVAGKRLVFLHGHRPAAFREALASAPDYLCHGHTHRLRDERLGATRVINPGALFRARAYTAALLDAGRDAVEVIAVGPLPR